MRVLKWLVILLPIVVLVATGGALWSASSQLLYPAWPGVSKDLAACPESLVAQWGDACGNLRLSKGLQFEEIRIPTMRGVELPGWRIGSEANGFGAAEGVVLLVHGGGSDRREMTRFARTFLARRLDVVTFDLACHGEAPCPSPGLSYGARESMHVVSAYLHVSATHPRVFAMGSSVGAAAVLIALPSMPRIAGVVAENPPASLERLITESPAAEGAPASFVRLMLDLAMTRGRFDGTLAPERVVRLVRDGPPILFVHSRRDSVVSHRHSEDLAAAYPGPKTTWFPETGDHGGLWLSDRAAYEERIEALLDSAVIRGAARE